MILNPCKIEEITLTEIKNQKRVEASNSLNIHPIEKGNRETSELKIAKTYEEGKSNLTAERQIEKQEKHQTDYNNIIINKKYNVNNLYNEATEKTEMYGKNKINITNQNLPKNLVEQHNIKANFFKKNLKLKENALYNTSEKLRNNQEFPALNNNSVNVCGNIKNNENFNDYAKFVQLKDRNNKSKFDESKVKVSNSKTPNNNSTVKRYDLNLNLPIERRDTEFNLSSKNNNIPKIITKNRSSAHYASSKMNKEKLIENLKNFSQEKSLFGAKNNKGNYSNTPLLDNPNASNIEKEISFFANKEVEFNNSKQNNFEYSFMERKSKNTSHKNLANIPSNKVSNNKSSYLLKSEDNSYIIKNVDKIYNTYENYEDKNSNKKCYTPLPNIPKYYGNIRNNKNNKKLKINLSTLKKDYCQNHNYELSPMNNPNYSSNIKDRIINLSTNENMISNTSNNINNKYSPIKSSLPVANFNFKKTPVNNFSKLKKFVNVNSNQ